MKKILYFPTLILLASLISCNTMKKDADLIIHNTSIYTLDDAFSVQECLVIKDGKILAVGGDELLDTYFSKNMLDAGGKYIYPGFYDAHCHFLSYGVGKMQRADLKGTTSFDEVVERVVEHSKVNPSEWIEGRGWDQNDWETKEFPDREKLDKLFPDRPVLLIRIDGHAALVNGEALRRAGITADTEVPGGDIIIKNGEPSGVLIDNAIEIVRDLIPEEDPELKKAGLMAGQEDCFATGLTSVMDAGLKVADIRLIDSLQQAGVLKIKINAMLSSMDSNYLTFMQQGEYKTDRLHVNSIKLFADGALGSRGACMIHDYSDDPGNYGLIMHKEEFYRAVIENAVRYNYQVNTHAIGDSGNRFILELYAEYLGGPNDRRWRVEHAQVIHEDDFDIFKQYNIIPSVQATHATSDMYWAIDRVGPERMKGAYAYRRLLSLNGWMPNGTDFPIEKISPLLTFYAAVVRKDLEGFPEGGFQMQDALNREEALRSITIWAAKAAFEEKEKGSLEAGKDADIVILDSDLMAIEELEIPKVNVLNTFVNGEMVFGAMMK
ncbi:MAG: amidohydrolase [Bacteroidetes bacterium]|nr:amidohydrolase [Bacteroidota bacterium]